ncbi:MAG: hypothetical protein IT342_17125 [Candidatus Melainabacteria bacterium]|nr:hypothetical protein [Candidatus Melainabacteria bacterium]
MVFVIITGGKSKRLTGKRGGDKFDLNARYRADERRYHRECKLAAERKSARRQARVLDSEAVSVFTTGVALEQRRKPVVSFLTDDGNTRVTIRYNADGMAVCAHIRPAGYYP